MVRERQDKASFLERLIHPEKNLVARLGILCIEIDKEVAGMIPGVRREYGLIVAAKTTTSPLNLIVEQGRSRRAPSAGKVVTT